MCISHKINSPAVISTLLNLATSKRALMILWNPAHVQREYWNLHLNVFGVSLVYFSLDYDGPMDADDEYSEFAQWAEYTPTV